MPRLVSCLGALSLMCLAVLAGDWSAPANADTAPALTPAACQYLRRLSQVSVESEPGISVVIEPPKIGAD